MSGTSDSPPPAPGAAAHDAEARAVASAAPQVRFEPIAPAPQNRRPLRRPTPHPAPRAFEPTPSLPQLPPSKAKRARETDEFAPGKWLRTQGPEGPGAAVFISSTPTTPTAPATPGPAARTPTSPTSPRPPWPAARLSVCALHFVPAPETCAACAARVLDERGPPAAEPFSSPRQPPAEPGVDGAAVQSLCYCDLCEPSEVCLTCRLRETQRGVLGGSRWV